MPLDKTTDEENENIAWEFGAEIADDVAFPTFRFDSEMFDTIGDKDNSEFNYPDIDNPKVWEMNFYDYYGNMEYLVSLICERIGDIALNINGWYFKPIVKIEGSKVVVTENWEYL